jgi:hypothetical protein
MLMLIVEALKPKEANRPEETETMNMDLMFICG